MGLTAFGGHAAKTREFFSLGWLWQVYALGIKEGQNMGGGGQEQIAQKKLIEPLFVSRMTEKKAT